MQKVGPSRSPTPLLELRYGLGRGGDELNSCVLHNLSTVDVKSADDVAERRRVAQCFDRVELRNVGHHVSVVSDRLGEFLSEQR